MFCNIKPLLWMLNNITVLIIQARPFFVQWFFVFLNWPLHSPVSTFRDAWHFPIYFHVANSVLSLSQSSSYCRMLSGMPMVFIRLKRRLLLTTSNAALRSRLIIEHCLGALISRIILEGLNCLTQTSHICINRNIWLLFCSLSL